MPPPAHILAKADVLADNETVETSFYPLYNAILSFLFPAHIYEVAPQWNIQGSRRLVDFVVSPYPTAAAPRQHPVLLLEIKPPNHFNQNSMRKGAIKQLMNRLDDIGPRNNAGRLYAISAVGKHWRACRTVTGNGSTGAQPVRHIADITSLRSANEGCWNPDITSDDSWEALEMIVERIRLDFEQGKHFCALACSMFSHCKLE
jgi:hypothetical protein